MSDLSGLSLALVPDYLRSILGALDPVFLLFRDPAVAMGLSLAMLAAGVVIAGWFRLFRIAPLFHRLAVLSRRLRALPDARSFTQNFQSFDEAITKFRHIKHAWEEFRETLIMPEVGSGDVIRNTARPGD